MSEVSLYELSGSELDAVAAAQGNQGVGQAGLVNVAAQLQDFLNNPDITVTVLDNGQIQIANNSLNGNTVQVGVGAAVAILGGAASGVLNKVI